MSTLVKKNIGLRYGYGTVSVVVPKTLPSVALIVVAPALTPVATPLVFRALLTVATVLTDELQVTDKVISWVPPPWKYPVALNGNVLPTAIVSFAGVTTMEKAVVVTVSAAFPDLPPKAAVMVVEPTPIAVASPLV